MELHIVSVTIDNKRRSYCAIKGRVQSLDDHERLCHFALAYWLII